MMNGKTVRLIPVGGKSTTATFIKLTLFVVSEFVAATVITCLEACAYPCVLATSAVQVEL